MKPDNLSNPFGHSPVTVKDWHDIINGTSQYSVYRHQKVSRISKNFCVRLCRQLIVNFDYRPYLVWTETKDAILQDAFEHAWTNVKEGDFVTIFQNTQTGIEHFIIEEAGQ